MRPPSGSSRPSSVKEPVGQIDEPAALDLSVPATVTMRAGDMPDVVTADSYTLQTVGGTVSLVMDHGVSRWKDPIPGTVSSTSDSVAVRMTGKQFRVLIDLLEASRPEARVCLTLDIEEYSLMATIDRWSARVGASRLTR